jgi:chromate reductase, NAD(P)H dehydrogenase (quinone)
VKLAPSEFSFKEVQIDDLPFYNQDDDAKQAKSVKRMKAEIAAAQGLLFVTPEYNRSIPGVLKNAIDHASRPYGQSAWAGKPAGVLGALSEPPARPKHNNICATFSHIWTCRRLVNPKHSSM